MLFNLFFYYKLFDIFRNLINKLNKKKLFESYIEIINIIL